MAYYVILQSSMVAPIFSAYNDDDRIFAHSVAHIVGTEKPLKVRIHYQTNKKALFRGYLLKCYDCQQMKLAANLAANMGLESLSIVSNKAINDCLLADLGVNIELA